MNRRVVWSTRLIQLPEPYFCIYTQKNQCNTLQVVAKKPNEKRAPLAKKTPAEKDTSSEESSSDSETEAAPKQKVLSYAWHNTSAI